MPARPGAALIGAILAPGKRTVSSALHAMGLSQEKRFHRYHRVLSRASWSSREVSRLLLGLLVEMFVPEGEALVVGIDETLERGPGKKIAAKGVYRDPVRSTHEHFVKSRGLRWVCVMLLVEIPWASGVWALPFLSLSLCPGSFRALCRQAGRATQEDNRVGLAAALAGKALVSTTRES
jgi:DDE superfamily endonuclease